MVSGGAFRRYDAATAEVKRVWTHPRHRRIYLTTGPRQPEAVRLYPASGYDPQFDVADRPTRGPLAFVKDLHLHT
ncbi:GNAT family N-acetyltransferase [Nonomuraea jabiensis]|uniref:Uncharacterized protein n=1 Tax=Nonomuraea jabiensis TaxID=882448 RepID=A0A7W9FY30_9ACTN|nr:hypothetical protein [Nonomuraea jabiensis]MBB5773656.1 hypothetical protein [Nonomuraea jabiensis]